MRGTNLRCSLLSAGLGLLLASCAGHAPAPQTPSSSEPTEEVRRSDDSVATADPPRSGQSLDVGMEFKDEGDDHPRANREAPPTAAWKPIAKEKATEPKKDATTASR